VPPGRTHPRPPRIARIFGSLRFGVSPVIKATAAMMLVLTLAAIVGAFLVLRRSAQSRAI